MIGWKTGQGLNPSFTTGEIEHSSKLSLNTLTVGSNQNIYQSR